MASLKECPKAHLKEPTLVRSMAHDLAHLTEKSMVLLTVYHLAGSKVDVKEYLMASRLAQSMVMRWDNSTVHNLAHLTGYLMEHWKGHLRVR